MTPKLPGCLSDITGLPGGLSSSRMRALGPPPPNQLELRLRDAAFVSVSCTCLICRFCTNHQQTATSTINAIIPMEKPAVAPGSCANLLVKVFSEIARFDLDIAADSHVTVRRFRVRNESPRRENCCYSSYRSAAGSSICCCESQSCQDSRRVKMKR